MSLSQRQSDHIGSVTKTQKDQPNRPKAKTIQPVPRAGKRTKGQGWQLNGLLLAGLKEVFTKTQPFLLTRQRTKGKG